MRGFSDEMHAIENEILRRDQEMKHSNMSVKRAFENTLDRQNTSTTMFQKYVNYIAS